MRRIFFSLLVLAGAFGFFASSVSAEMEKPLFFDEIHSQEDVNQLSFDQRSELSTYLALRAIENPDATLDVDSLAVSLDKDKYVVGDTIHLDLSWSSDMARGYTEYSASNDEDIPMISAKIGVVGAGDILCAEKTDAFFSVTDFDPSFALDISNDCRVSFVIISMTDWKGRLIEEWVVEDILISGEESRDVLQEVSQAGIFSDSFLKKGILILIGILFALSMVLIVFRRAESVRRGSGFKTWLILGLVSAGVIAFCTPSQAHAASQNLKVVCSADGTRASFYWDDWETRGDDGKSVFMRPPGNYSSDWSGYKQVLPDGAGRYFAADVNPGTRYDWKVFDYNDSIEQETVSSFTCDPQAPIVSSYASWSDIPSILVEQDWVPAGKVFFRHSAANAQECDIDSSRGTVVSEQNPLSSQSLDYTHTFDRSKSRWESFQEWWSSHESFSETFSCSGIGGVVSSQATMILDMEAREDNFYRKYPNIRNFGFVLGNGISGSNIAYEGSWIYGSDTWKMGMFDQRALDFNVMGVEPRSCTLSDSHGLLSQDVGSPSNDPLYFIVEPTTFTLTCMGENGKEISVDYTAEVIPAPVPPTPAPTLTFFASSLVHPDPNNVPDGASVDLGWYSDNASSCEVTGGDWYYGPSGNNTRGTDGVEPIGPLEYDSGDGDHVYNYELTCSGPGGSVTGSVAVTVEESDISTDLYLCDHGTSYPSADPIERPSGTEVTMTEGQHKYLTAHYGTAGDCSVDPDITFAVDTSFSESADEISFTEESEYVDLLAEQAGPVATLSAFYNSEETSLGVRVVTNEVPEEDDEPSGPGTSRTNWKEVAPGE